jgi:1,2-diacylglycerol 3-alpha-glucosyltransferase
VLTVPAYGFYQALPSGRTIRRIFEQVRPDIVHHHYVGYMMMRVCGIACQLLIPQVSTYHFSSEVLTQPLPMRPFAPLVRRLLVWYNNRFDLIIAPSRKLVEQIVGEGVKTPVQFITNPVAFEGLADVEPAVRTAGFTILYAGRLSQEKNLGYLISAFSALLTSVHDAILWVAGRGPELANLEALCLQLRIADKVKFLGFLDHPTLARNYAACDVFVLPSLVETQGLVAMEAMRFSKPIIVTKQIVSAEELVEHGVNGYIVDPDQVEDLSQCLQTLAANPTLRTLMGDASWGKSQAFQPELVATATVAGYRETIARTCYGK